VKEGVHQQVKGLQMKLEKILQVEVMAMITVEMIAVNTTRVGLSSPVQPMKPRAMQGVTLSVAREVFVIVMLRMTMAVNTAVKMAVRSLIATLNQNLAVIQKMRVRETRAVESDDNVGTSIPILTIVLLELHIFIMHSCQHLCDKW